MKSNSAYNRKRKFLLMVPLLVLPFLTLIFWSLGGGKGPALPEAAGTPTEGLNLNLPGAHLTEEKLDKLGYYEKADSDSTKLRAAIKADPYYDKDLVFPDDEAEEEFSEDEDSKLKRSPYEHAGDPHSAKVYAKLKQLDEAMEDAAQPSMRSSGQFKPDYNLPVASEQVQRLEHLLKESNEVDGDGDDPELQTLNSMLDKIKDIQHPELVKQRLQRSVVPEKTLLVSSHSVPDTIADGFYPVAVGVAANDLSGSSVPAVVHADQSLVNGSVVKLRLLNDLFIGQDKIPSGSFVSGIVNLQEERLQIQISSVRYGARIYPVSLLVYDTDGLAGIYIPGAITRNAAKKSMDEALQSPGITTPDPSLAAQATSAGINTARSLLSKKVKLVKVTVKSGYQVFLQNKN